MRRSRSGALYPTAASIAAASMIIPFRSSLTPERSITGATVTHTRASIATVQDQDGVTHSCTSTEARFNGANRRRNGIQYSDLTSWTKQTLGTGSAAVVTNNYATAPDGTLTATRVQCALNGGTTASDASDIYVLFTAPAFTATDNGMALVYLKTADGARKNIVFSLTGPKQVVTIDGTWRKYIIRRTSTAVSLLQIGLVGGVVAIVPDVSDSADILVWHPMGCKTTGQSDIYPLEYLSAGTVRYYDYQRSSRRLSCYGDSLTFGAGSSVPYTAFLADSLDYKSEYNYGVSGETSTQIKTRLLASTTLADETVIIWAGRNNYSSAATVLADIAAMVAFIGHTNYVVLSIINGDYATEYTGGVDYTKIANLNASLSSTYGIRYIDVRTPLVAAYDPLVAQDVTDYANDIPPSTLRYDALHLNSLGYKVVADTIKTHCMTYLSWEVGAISYITSQGLLTEPARTNEAFPSGPGVPAATCTTRALSATAYTLSFKGTGNVTGTGGFVCNVAGTGLNTIATFSAVATAAAATLTVTGTVTEMQLEAGDKATSVIPTTTAFAPRNADVATIPTSGNLTAAAGTVYFEYQSLKGTSAVTQWMLMSFTDASNYTAVFITAAGVVTLRKRIAATNYDATYTLGNPVVGTIYKIAGSWGASGVLLSVSGTAGTPHANTTNAVLASTLQAGQYSDDICTVRNLRVCATQLSSYYLNSMTAS